MDEFISVVKRLLNDKKTTRREVAAEVGMSTSTLSMVLNNKYSGKAGPVHEKVEQWLSSQRNKEVLHDAVQGSGLTKPAYFKMEATKSVFTSLQLAQSIPAISMMYGGPGIGKTEAAQQYKKNSSHVWIITVSRSGGTFTAVLRQLRDLLKIKKRRCTTAELSVDIKKTLQGKKGLIIIDEAQYLSGAALQELRIICEGIAGIALIGNGEIRDRMTSLRTRDEMEPVWSRMIRAVDMDELPEADVVAYIRAWGFTDADCIALLTEYGLKANGALRTVDFIIQMAASFAGEDVSADQININHITLAWAQIEEVQEERRKDTRRNMRTLAANKK